MYNVTQEFINAIKQNGRKFKSSITIRDTTFDDNNIIDINLEENVNPTESFMLGGVGSSKLEVTLINVPDALILEDANITATISLLINGAYEDVPLGVFTVDDVSKDKNKVKLQCFDNMIKLEKAYFSDLSYPTDINNVANEICTKVEIQLVTVLPNLQIDKIDGYTYREAIGFIASFLGGFARFNRIGKLEIITYTDSSFSITDDNYSKLLTAEQLFTVGKLTCKVGDNILTAGTNGTEIQFENPIMTQDQLNSIYNALKNLSYMPYNMDWQGNQALQAGDKITITDLKGNAYNTLLMDNKITYKGGLSGTASAVGKTETGQNFNSSGSLKNSVDRIVIEQANIKLVLAEKVSTLELEANYAHMINGIIDNATIDVGHINNLYGNYAHLVNGVIDNATIDVAHVNNLSSTYATIVDLTAATGRIATLESSSASITTLLAGNLSAENMQTNFITATSGMIANAAISKAMIISLDVSQLNAGDISTTKFRVVSDAGNLLVADNTIQIKDATRVRVQIGKDASNDYNMYVWDASGNLMFDALGLKASGIKDKIIRDDMVSDTANIDAKKINITSLFSQMNGSTSTLKAGRIYLDTQAQTLDVAFTSLNSTVTGQGSTITSQGTSISTIQGQISSKIWSTDITTAVNGIQVGGRNLLKNSRLNYIPSANPGTGTINEIVADASQGSVLHSNKQYVYGTELSTSVPIDNGAWITVSFYVKSLSGTQLSFALNDGATVLSSSVATTTSWSLCQVTAKTIKSSVSGVKLYIYCSNGEYWLKNVKVEIGTKATDWTPAPEDVQGQIDATNTNITTNYSTTTQTNSLISSQVSSVSTDLHTNYSTTSAMNTAINTSANGVLSTVSSTYATISSVNSKSKVFTSQPVPPYSVGDLWISSTSSGNNMVCTTARATGSYTASDWTKDSVTQRMSTAESTINQQAGLIDLKVSKDGVIASINISPETIKLSASKIDLSGYVTITSLSTPGATTIDGGNITSGTITGALLKTSSTANYMWLHDQYLEIYSGGYNSSNKVMQLGYSFNGSYLFPKISFFHSTALGSDEVIVASMGANGMISSSIGEIDNSLLVYGELATTGGIRFGVSQDRSGQDCNAQSGGSFWRGCNLYNSPDGAGQTGNWFHFIEMAHADNAWDCQIASHYFQDQLYFRRKNGGTWQSWHKILWDGTQWGSIQNFYTDYLRGWSNGDQIYLGTSTCRIDTTGGTARFQSSASNYISIDGNSFSVYIGGTSRFTVSSTGTKTGGTIDIEGTTYGMAPIDSPRQVIEDFYLNQWVDAGGTTIQLDARYAKSIAEYGVFISNSQVEVLSKDATSFTVKGYTGIVDIRVVGYRKDSLDYYYPVMNTMAA